MKRHTHHLTPTVTDIVRVIVIVIVISHSHSQVHAQTLAPQGTYDVVRIYDGDTFTILTTTNQRYNIRISGIDAPERLQEYGLYARTALVNLIHGKPVTITPIELDRYGRTIAICYNYDGLDIALQLLRAGMAWHYKSYDNTTRYIEAETEARYCGEGIWSNPNAINPQDYRKLSRNARLKHQ